MSSSSITSKAELARVVGLGGAVLLGLGSILGTGVFVSLGIAAGIVGPWVVVAVVLAAVVATCNGLSSAQLAAAHPVSGGTYEYGYRLLTPALGFSAGWMFLCAKSASAATAALGLAGYVLDALGVEGAGARTLAAELVAAVLVGVVLGGMGRSKRVNALMVGATLAVLGAFVLAGAGAAVRGFGELPWTLDAGGSSGPPPRALLEATALLFVAYTGYGRVATLGEEIRDPARNIPRAVVVTLAATMVLYACVAFVAVGVAGPAALAAATAETAAPLELAARVIGTPGLAAAVALAACSAMAGVLLNLVLGLSRVALAMGRRGDVPRALARVESGSPRAAVLAVGAVIALLVLLGDVRTTWSFSAASVLVYYALTNLAALRLPAGERRFPRWISVLGLVSCAGLVPWIEPAVVGAVAALLAVGLAWHVLAHRAG